MDQEGEDRHQAATDARWGRDIVIGYQRPLDELPYLDEDLLLRLQRNDPKKTVAGLTIDEVSWINGTGRAIGGSKYLRSLIIDVVYEPDGQDWLVDLWQGLSRNRSIEYLTLDLHESELGMNIEGIAPFLEHNTNLRCISLREVDYSPTFNTLVSALSKLNNGRLECVELLGARYTDEQVAKFFNSLSEHHSLIELNFYRPNIGRVGCTAFANWFTNPLSSNIVKLSLEANDFDDYSIVVFSNALIHRNTLKSLVFTGDHNEPTTKITNAGWHAFFTIFSKPLCSIEHLSLNQIPICDEGVAYFGDALAVNQTLKYLRIGMNMSFTLSGWQLIAKCFRNPNTVLEELDLSWSKISTDGMLAVLTALAGNSTVERLNLSTIHTIEVATVYKALCHLLCDKTSIDSTFSSNHTLSSILIRKIADKVLWQDLCSPRKLNTGKNKLEVALRKILKHHFSDEATASCSLSQLTIFPHAMARIGTIKIGFAPMYYVVRAFPMLFACPMTTKRRKL